MGYYTIRLDSDASKICTIIFPWGKNSYLRLPMGIACSPDIFQATMSELMGTLEFVWTYIDDQLCITKGSLDDHLRDFIFMVIYGHIPHNGHKTNSLYKYFLLKPTIVKLRKNGFKMNHLYFDDWFLFISVY